MDSRQEGPWPYEPFFTDVVHVDECGRKTQVVGYMHGGHLTVSWTEPHHTRLMEPLRKLLYIYRRRRKAGYMVEQALPKCLAPSVHGQVPYTSRLLRMDQP